MDLVWDYLHDAWHRAEYPNQRIAEDLADRLIERFAIVTEPAYEVLAELMEERGAQQFICGCVYDWQAAEFQYACESHRDRLTPDID